MLTIQELRSAREKLHTAHTLAEDLKGLFLCANRHDSARAMNECAHCLIEQLCIIDRELAEHE